MNLTDALAVAVSHGERSAEHQKQAILAALRAELPLLSCYEPSRLIGQPCSCVVGMARAIEIVEATL